MFDMSDEARKKILERRATFVAAAIASLAASCEHKPPISAEPCLSAPPYEAGTPEDTSEPTATQDAEPLPCLSPMPPKEDAGPPPPPIPAPCLKVAPHE